jgi:hypothetical protein
MRTKHGNGANEQPVEKKCRRVAGNVVIFLCCGALNACRAAV